MTKPRIGIIPGDPGGIGPELIAKLLNQPETAEKADILLIGDAHLFTLGQEQAGADFRCAHAIH
jgi:4-hydroxythreonine-4-phosphate dehydrogenase